MLRFVRHVRAVNRVHPRSQERQRECGKAKSDISIYGQESNYTTWRLAKMNLALRGITIDWTMRENVRAQLRVIVKRILRKYGYPPDKQEKATQTVLEQVELLGWETAA
ncbi:MAG TPA: type I restriction enzyme endonuclease domain-containing protein [Candidatus Binatia bacterium]